MPQERFVPSLRQQSCQRRRENCIGGPELRQTAVLKIILVLLKSGKVNSDLCVHNVGKISKRGSLRQTTKCSVVIVAGEAVVSASLNVNASQIHTEGLVGSEQELGNLAQIENSQHLVKSNETFEKIFVCYSSKLNI